MQAPKYILVSPVNAAVIETFAKYGGRNWRRIKREINKAVKHAKQKSRTG